MANTISKNKSGSKTTYVIDGSDSLLETLAGIYMASRNPDGTIGAKANNKRQAAEIEAAVEKENAKPVANPCTKPLVSRYVEMVNVAERDGLNHGRAWIASERDIDVHQLPPHVGGEAVCYVYNN